MFRTGGVTIATMGLVAFLALLVALLAWYGGPASAQSTATTITVNTAADESKSDGNCSLREAIRAAESNTAVDACAAGQGRSEDTIQFSLGQEATITLQRPLPPITRRSGLTIFGGETESIVVSGNDDVRVFAVRKDAKLDLRNLTVADGFAQATSDGGQIGGGVKNNGGDLRVFRSTFVGNNALAVGGGIANISGGTLTVKNSTFSNNKAGSAGGGILNDGTLRVTYSTFSGNDAELVGGGIQNSNDRGSVVTLGSTVLARSANGNINNVCAGGQCRGQIIDGGYNISDDASFRFTTETSRSRTRPRFDPDGLQDNGGPTETIGLRGISPAINFIPKGTNGCGTTTRSDQRGVHRPQPQGRKCDAGAFEKVLQR
jgi:CSLREA domain-containing protein